MEPTHYVFVDFENVQSVNLDLITGKPVQIILVIGRKQTKVPWELVKKLMEHSSQVRVVETEAGGKNALDFVLAYEAGVQSAADPEGAFHILSRDQGFDALVLHLRHRHRKAARHIDFSKIPVLAGPETQDPLPAKPPLPAAKKQSKAAAIASLSERVTLMAERFARNQANRPKRRKTLLSHINGYFAKELTEAELEAILDGLVAAGVITFTSDGAVQYNI
jgi:PIN domain